MVPIPFLLDVCLNGFYDVPLTKLINILKIFPPIDVAVFILSSAVVFLLSPFRLGLRNLPFEWVSSLSFLEAGYHDGGLHGIQFLAGVFSCCFCGPGAQTCPSGHFLRRLPCGFTSR